VYKNHFYGVAKKSRTGIPGQVNNRNFLVGLSLLIVILTLVIIAACVSKTSNGTPEATWSLDESHAVSFSHREPITSQERLIEDTANYSLEKITYSSYNTTVYGLLRVPKNVGKPPVVVVLPAATVTQEEDAPMAEALSSWGYASLTLDERENGGETMGSSPMDFMTGF